MECDYDIIVVGGGLAGLTASLHLINVGHRVLVVEKQSYPQHKVCGEYVSNEIAPYLESLGVSIKETNAVAIDTLLLSTAGGKCTQTALSLGGMGLSRYAFDNTLYRKALAKGVFFVFESALSINFKNDVFQVVTDKKRTYTSTIVIGAYGKRSSLDKGLNRNFIQQKSSWMAVKSHYALDSFPENIVALHNFQGGYGGLSKTETGAVNFCYLASYESFQKEKNIESFNANVVAKNLFLKDFLQKATPLFERPLTIAQISFRPKKAVVDHVLMCGDTAGLIHPLCGNGMAMAIHSAKIASELVDTFLKTPNADRKVLEYQYQIQWNRAFGRRLWAGKQWQKLLLNPKLSDKLLSFVIHWPKVLSKLIRTTHGTPLHR